MAEEASSIKGDIHLTEDNAIKVQASMLAKYVKECCNGVEKRRLAKEGLNSQRLFILAIPKENKK